MQATFEHNRDVDDKPHVWYSINNRTPAHFHSNIELICVLEGEIAITINGRTEVLKKGDTSAALSYDIHAYQTVGSSSAYVVIIPAVMVKSFVSQTGGCSFASPFLHSGPHIDELLACIRGLGAAISDGENLLKAKGYAYCILSIISAALPYGERVVPSQATLPKRIVHFLQSKYLEPITLDDVSAHFGYNRQYFSRFFNSYFGCGLHEYINMLRARHAAILLKESDASISQIALESGFDTHRTFNRAFLRVFGRSPGDFRKNPEIIL